MPSDRFLNRWSRMKARARPQRVAMAEDVDGSEHELTLDMPDADPVAGAVSDLKDAPKPASAPNESPDEPMDEDAIAAKAEELGLPALDTLGPGSDFRGFMARDVPDQLRNLALRRLWRSNPVLANLDGLNVYEEDYSDAAKVIPNMQSAYQVGRGYFRDPEPEVPQDPPEGGAEADSTLSDAEGPDGVSGRDGEEMAEGDSEKAEQNLDVAVQHEMDDEAGFDELGIDNEHQIGHT